MVDLPAATFAKVNFVNAIGFDWIRLNCRLDDGAFGPKPCCRFFLFFFETNPLVFSLLGIDSHVRISFLPSGND